MALGSAILFAMSVQGGRWWTIGEVAEVGPFGTKRCFANGDCEPSGMSWLGASDRWVRTGMGTWAAGLMCTLLLVVLAAALAAKRMPRLVAKTAMVSIVTALIVGVLFVATYPGGDLGESSLARGALLFVVAIALGAIAAIRVLRTPT
jgi:hypothetical protein